MLDDDARRALEQEAIALVSLSASPALLQQPKRLTNPDDRRVSVAVFVDAARSPTSTAGPADLSMQSLLVNLKKRKPEDDPAPVKLPRFRDVFEPAIHVRAAPTVSYAPASPASAPEDAPLKVENAPFPPPPELKCKYRTGKCGNVRALKSCGDYHNLCNYHRLRANANQRKLDRKKKVQRGQPAEASSPVAAAPTVSAAASTLAALPSSFLLPRVASAPHSARHDAAPFLPYLMPPPASSSSATSPPKTC